MNTALKYQVSALIRVVTVTVNVQILTVWTVCRQTDQSFLQPKTN